MENAATRLTDALYWLYFHLVPESVRGDLMPRELLAYAVLHWAIPRYLGCKRFKVTELQYTYGGARGSGWFKVER